MNKIERPLLNADLLRTFAAIAESGNLTIAAGRLARTQSAISVQLRKLESDLGVSLFTRTSSGMELTEAGRALLPKAHGVISQLQEASTLFQPPLSGSIRVGIPDDFDDQTLKRVLGHFMRAHPGVNVVAQSGCTSHYPDAIRRGDLDIAVCSGPSNQMGEALEAEPSVWAAAKGFDFAPDRALPLAVLDRRCWWRDAPINALTKAGRDHRIAFKSSSFAALCAALRAGIAVGVLPASSIDNELIAAPRSAGLPALPVSQRTIAVRPDAPADLTKAMAAAIREARLRRSD